MNPALDLHIGRKLRRRRIIVGWTQVKLAEAIGVRHQSIQKYECGANQISAPRLWACAQVLEIPIAYFYDDLPSRVGARVDPLIDETVETDELVQTYYGLGDRQRRTLLGLLKATQSEKKKARKHAACPPVGSANYSGLIAKLNNISPMPRAPVANEQPPQ